MLGIVTAATRLYLRQGGGFPVTDDLLCWTGNGVHASAASSITYGMVIMLVPVRR